MWVILVSRQTDAPGTILDRRQLDYGQIVIGRSLKHCDLVLPDESGFLSRQHCVIRAEGLDLTVTDTSKNGVMLNQPGQRIVPGQPVPIRPGDRLLIHDFVIAVTTPADAAGHIMTEPPPPPLPAGGSTAGDDIWSAGASNPFGFDPGAGAGGFSFESGAAGADPFAPAAFPADGGFGFAPAPFAAPPPPPPFTPIPPLGDFGFGEPIGQAFEPRPIMADPLPASGGMGIPEDWANPGNGVGDGMPIPDFAPVQVAAPVASPVAQPVAAPGGAPDWSAFYEGAGFTPEEMPLPPDAMRRLGVMYRQVVLGLCDILQDRATFKDEFRIERTQIANNRNNPLKHLAAFDAARVVLGQPLPGFMDGEEALRASFQDLKRHQMAMMAGVQNALVTAFSRLSPAEMEKLAGTVAAQKKGFLGLGGVDRWSLYVSVYENLRKDATSNASGIMSSAFREGYENYMKSAQ